MQLPEWERLLWQGRPWRPDRWCAGERYLLTDFRLVRLERDDAEEIALDDITDVRRTETRLDRILGTSTLAVHSRRRSPVVLVSVRRGQQLAALLELLAGDPRAPRDAEATRSALAWNPRSPAIDLRQALGSIIAVLIAIFGVVIGLHGTTAAVSYAPDDAIAPGGEKRSEADIIAFMERDVLPWARRTLGPIKGGADRITCETCHGEGADATKLADASGRRPSTARSARSWLGNVYQHDGRADAQRDLRLHRRIRQSVKGRLHARSGRPRHGAPSSSSRLRFHQALRVQPRPPVHRLLSLPSEVKISAELRAIIAPPRQLHMTDDKPVTLADLDARLREVEALQELILRILSTTKPLTNVLDQYGATETQARACHALLDDLATRAKGNESNRPTFAYFKMKVAEIFPSLRGDREFLELLLDTLKLERCAYRELHEYMTAPGRRDG